MRSAPTEIASRKEKGFECFAETGVNTPAPAYHELGRPYQAFLFHVLAERGLGCATPPSLTAPLLDGFAL